MPVRSWRTGYGPSGGYQFSHEDFRTGALVYTKSVEINHREMTFYLVPGLRLKVEVYELWEHVWAHGLGLTKIYRGLRTESVGFAPAYRPPLERY
jgi:hypothetical protein